MTTGEFGGRLADAGVVTAWNRADGVGAMTTADAGHEVWFHVSACAAGLSAADVAVGLRVQVTYVPVEDQDGFRWLAWSVAPFGSAHVGTNPAAGRATEGGDFSVLQIGPVD